MKLTPTEQERVEQLLPIAQRVARRFDRSDPDFEAEAALSLVKAVARLRDRPAPADLERYATCCVFNALKKLFNKKRRTRDREISFSTLGAAVEAKPDESPAFVAHEVLAQLPLAEREAATAVWLSGRDETEVADEMGITLVELAVLLHRARKNLKELLP